MFISHLWRYCCWGVHVRRVFSAIYSVSCAGIAVRTRDSFRTAIPTLTLSKKQLCLTQRLEDLKLDLYQFFHVHTRDMSIHVPMPP